MVSDSIGDFIVRLKNAGVVNKESVVVPYSKLRHSVALKLNASGYLGDISKRGKKIQRSLEIELRYDKGGDPVIHGVKRVSKPGRRMYKAAADIHPVRHGKGALIMSTPKGILTGEEARKQHVGGEALFEIW